LQGRRRKNAGAELLNPLCPRQALAFSIVQNEVLVPNQIARASLFVPLGGRRPRQDGNGEVVCKRAEMQPVLVLELYTIDMIEMAKIIGN
jgi:hypothetical protein